jgi:hypothetical protein
VNCTCSAFTKTLLPHSSDKKCDLEHAVLLTPERVRKLAVDTVSKVTGSSGGGGWALIAPA